MEQQQGLGYSGVPTPYLQGGEPARVQSVEPQTSSTISLNLFKFDKVPVLDECENVTDKHKWNSFLQISLSLLGQIGAKTIEIKAARKLAPSSSTPSKNSSVLNNLFESQVRSIQLAKELNKSSLASLVTFWTSEEETIRLLWDDTTHWTSKYLGIETRLSQLKIFLDQKQKELTVSQSDIEFCVRKKILLDTCDKVVKHNPLVYEVFRDAVNITTGWPLEFLEGSKTLKELCEDEKRPGVAKESALETDRENLVKFYHYCIEVQKIFRKMNKVRDGANILDHIYYYCPLPKVAKIDIEKIREKFNRQSDKFSALEMPTLQGTYQIEHAGPKNTIQQRQRNRITALQKEIGTKLDSLKRYTNEKEEGGLTLEAQSFVDARSTIRQDSIILNQRIVALLKEAQIRIIDKETFAEFYKRSEKLNNAASELKAKKVNYILSLHEALGEANARMKTLENLDKQICESAVELQNYLKSEDVYDWGLVERSVPLQNVADDVDIDDEGSMEGRKRLINEVHIEIPEGHHDIGSDGDEEDRAGGEKVRIPSDDFNIQTTRDESEGEREGVDVGPEKEKEHN